MFEKFIQVLGGKRTPGGALCHCPAHEDHTPSLSIGHSGESYIWHCFAGCDSKDVYEALIANGLLKRKKRRHVLRKRKR